MKVLHLSTTDLTGGAALAASRLHRGLVACGCRSEMLVQTKSGDDPLVSGPGGRLWQFVAKLRYGADALPAIIGRRGRGATFSPANLPERVASRVAGIAPDVIHLHWIAGGFVRLETLARFGRPVVWTLHDMWPFTGGCHYGGECSRYRDACGCCPELDSGKDNDLSRRIWRRKARAWAGVAMTIIAPSRWMAACARASSLFAEADIRVIPNCIDTTVFKPADRLQAREILRLPKDRRLILFGAMSPAGDPRKGFHRLLPAIRELAADGWGERAELLVYGGNRETVMPDLGMKVLQAGQVHDEATMALLNAAADVMVAPSIQDNLPNTVIEALACGTPVVAFRIGGMPDLIDHEENGWLADPFDHRDLARGLVHLLEDVSLRELMGRKAREKVARDYAEEIVARRHMGLYAKLAEPSGLSVVHER